MNSWKIVSQIATAFGFVFIIFAALKAFITYGQITEQYGSNIPPSIVQLTVVGDMLPFMLFGVLSLVVAVFSLRSTKETSEKDMKPQIQELEEA